MKVIWMFFFLYIYFWAVLMNMLCIDYECVFHLYLILQKVSFYVWCIYILKGKYCIKSKCVIIFWYCKEIFLYKTAYLQNIFVYLQHKIQQNTKYEQQNETHGGA